MALTKSTKIKGYEFTTPKFSGGDKTQFENVYDFEIIELMFKTIMKLNKSKRKYMNETMSINLGNFQQSDDANMVEGYFITARHGVRRTHIDIETQEEIGTIEAYHGVEHKVHFMIDRNTGLLLIQDDFNKVFNRKLLHTFLHFHKELIYPYIDKFNQLNTQRSMVIHKRSSYRLRTLPPIDFFDELREFTKINSAILTLDSTTDKSTVDVSQILDKELEDNDIAEYDLEIKIKNKTRNRMIRVFETYFEEVIRQQKYDSYAIEGVLENGKTRRITPDTITRDFFGDVRYNANGEPNISDLYDVMYRIISRENPLSGKTGTPNIIPVGEDRDVNLAIEQKISERNEDTAGQEETS